jgi:cytoskeletal protein CcmA (bactofilin family)
MSIFNRGDKPPEAPAVKLPDMKAPETSGPAEPHRTIETPKESAMSLTSTEVKPASATPSARGAGSSVISKALKITGQLESSEDIQIDGDVDGDIRGVTVKIGNGATIKGNVYGDAVELAGTVEGKIEAKRVVLMRTARMTGDVIHQDIQIESGAYIDGHCRPEYGKNAQAPRALHAVSSPNTPPAAAKAPANGNTTLKAEFGSL